MEKYVSVINEILKKRNEVQLEADKQGEVVDATFNQLKNKDLTEEEVAVYMNNIGVFSKVLSTYEERISELDLLISSYSTLVMNKNRIDSDSYAKLMEEFNQKKESLLGFVEIDTREKKGKARK